MPHVTCAFSTFGVQNVILNGCWSVTAIGCLENTDLENTDLENADLENVDP